MCVCHLIILTLLRNHRWRDNKLSLISHFVTGFSVPHSFLSHMMPYIRDIPYVSLIYIKKEYIRVCRVIVGLPRSINEVISEANNTTNFLHNKPIHFNPISFSLCSVYNNQNQIEDSIQYYAYCLIVIQPNIFFSLMILFFFVVHSTVHIAYDPSRHLLY